MTAAEIVASSYLRLFVHNVEDKRALFLFFRCFFLFLNTSFVIFLSTVAFSRNYGISIHLFSISAVYMMNFYAQETKIKTNPLMPVSQTHIISYTPWSYSYITYISWFNLNIIFTLLGEPSPACEAPSSKACYAHLNLGSNYFLVFKGFSLARK